MLKGLERMEYHSYDSAGIAGLNNGEFTLKKEVGLFRNLLDIKNHSVNSGIFS